MVMQLERVDRRRVEVRPSLARRDDDDDLASEFEFEPSPTELNKNKMISIDSSNLEKTGCIIMLRRMRVLPLKSAA
jgi:hypothetical protein